MEMDDQCCACLLPQFLRPSQNTISMAVTTPPLKMVAIAMELPESWPLKRTNKRQQGHLSREDTSPCVHLKSLAKRECFSSLFFLVHNPETH